MKVLIVGAGPTGLTAALELARNGAQIHIIDKRPHGSGFSRAVGILPESLRLLKPSGLTDHLLKAGIKLERLKVFFDSQQAFALSLRDKSNENGFLLALAQDQTEALMRQLLSELGISVDFETELTDFQQDVDTVVAQFANGRSGKFDYLIGADGTGSTVRNIAGIKYPGVDLPEQWSIADVNAKDWQHNNAFVVCRTKGGRVAVVAQLEESRYRVISNTPDALASLPLALNVTKIHRQGKFRISVRQVTEYQKGRVFLAGDAAHCHSPVGGRGMNLGISDACELAERMVAGTTDGYSASRHAYGKHVIGGSERGRKFITRDSWTTKTLMKCIFAVANCSSSIRKRMIHFFLYG